MNKLNLVTRVGQMQFDYNLRVQTHWNSENILK